MYQIPAETISTIRTKILPALYSEGYIKEADELKSILNTAQARALEDWEYKRFVDLQVGLAKSEDKKIFIWIGIILLGFGILAWHGRKKK